MTVRSVRTAIAARPHAGFTLIELLVVVSIIALLIGILLPALSMARESARASTCLANCNQMGVAMVNYNTDHQDLNVPSYNMVGFGGAADPLAVTNGGTLCDGWGPILNRYGYAPGMRKNGGTIFFCPSTVDVEGMLGGQTGSDPSHPKGWMDWPNNRSITGTNNTAAAILPDYPEIIRVSYWINSDNPVGANTAFVPDKFYTSSVGYTNMSGATMRGTKASKILSPATLIVTADGVYAGKQNQNKIGITDSRIGYRHPGNEGVANTVFADGHAAPIRGSEFPVGNVKADNIDSSRPTLYINAGAFFP